MQCWFNILQTDHAWIRFTSFNECTDNILSSHFDVIKPTGVYYDGFSSPLVNTFHLKNRVSTGFVTDNYLLPDNVNFYNVEVKKGVAPAVIQPPIPPAVESYFNGNPPPHPANSFKQCKDVVHNGKGTKIDGPDIVRFIHSCRLDKNPILYGLFSYDIPQIYKDPKNNTEHEFCKINQSSETIGVVKNSTHKISKII